MTNASLIAAALLTFIIGTVHSWLGERRLIGPLLALDQRQGILANSAFARRILRFAWHLTTLAWWGIGAILGALALSPVSGQGRAILWIIALLFLSTGLVTLITSRGRHLAWPVFLAIAGLSLLPILQTAA